MTSRSVHIWLSLSSKKMIAFLVYSLLATFFRSSWIAPIRLLISMRRLLKSELLTFWLILLSRWRHLYREEKTFIWIFGRCWSSIFRYGRYFGWVLIFFYSYLWFIDGSEKTANCWLGNNCPSTTHSSILLLDFSNENWKSIQGRPVVYLYHDRRLCYYLLWFCPILSSDYFLKRNESTFSRYLFFSWFFPSSSYKECSYG